ncbi:hypothetical protein GH714_037261 [Hevea brasiliensis]|uniref:RNase H type-1 domain-containing protein n=1 Tax=Hevea brasiliensis TaxID=3981 RepID=A0A6A6KE42_HEVBR|nr:hypothetical protein GH714_037261 [Hevea brasiliensis]
MFHLYGGVLLRSGVKFQGVLVGLLEMESHLHVLRDCSLTQQVWFDLRPPGAWDNFVATNSVDVWIGYNISSRQLHHSGYSWALIFCVTCWMLWMRRNRVIFAQEYSSVSTIVQQILHFVFEVSRSFSLQQTNGACLLRVERLISWQLPTPGAFKLNIDGSVKGRFATGGGLIRNDQVRWIRGFAYNIGSCSVPCAELWALLEGIKLAWTLGIRSLQIECDSLLVVNMVKDDALLHNSLRPLVFLIKHFLSLEWQCELTHVYREANFSADYLMNYVASFPIGLHILEAPPPGVLHWLLHDSSG